MKYVCNRCGKVIQEHDVTIHYTRGSSGLEILAICQSCLDDYLKKTKLSSDRKDEDSERMKRKW
jgi:ribosome-binding protein aMBF1 (putative translation factor)